MPQTLPTPAPLPHPESGAIPGGRTVRRRPTVALAAALTLALGTGAAQAGTPEVGHCRVISDAAQRLKCFDEALQRADSAESGHSAASATVNAAVSPPGPAPAAMPSSANGFTLTDRWDLAPENRNSVFEIRRHKPVYVLPITYATSMNNRPLREAGGVQTLSGRPSTLDRSEAKFQLSLKTRAVAGIFGDVGDLWIGYTQSSRWQVYNKDSSRPFRETNHEPEAIVSFATNYTLLGWTGRVASLSLNHQSNGRAEPISRSWNRVIGEVSLERNDWTVSVRPWVRIQEAAAKDENPQIEDYVGRGELIVSKRLGQQVLTFHGRHSLQGGDRSRGSAQIDYAYPLSGQLFGYLQVFHGYGESLIDYNFKTTKVGLGLSLVQWR